MDYTALKKKVPESINKITVFQTAGVKPEGKLAIGFGLAEQAGEEAARFGTGKALLITDKTITKLGMHLVVTDSLEKAGFKVDTFDDVEPEPHAETAKKVQECVRKENYAVVVGLGGGSPLDMAKSASITATNPEDILRYIEGTPVTRAGLPSILIPTTSGTGSEISPFVVMSKADKKLFISSPYVFATIALVDPLLTVTMPPAVTASTGLDALSHGVEGLIAKETPIAEALTNKCAEYVFNYLERAYSDGTDLEARYYMSFASVLGMMSYTSGGGLYAHSLSYILTLRKGIPHGIGCGVAMPYTLMFNYDYIKHILINFARVIDPDVIIKSPEETALSTIEKFYDLLGKVGVSAKLEDLDVSEDQLAIFADELVNKYYRPKNPRKLSIEESLQLINYMWEGKLKRI